MLIALGAIPLLAQVHGGISTTLRKNAQIPYPNLMATPEQAKSNPAAYKFNLAQRAHGNLLENMPQAIASTLVAGLVYPRAAPVLASIWLLGRIVYAYGYIMSTKPHGKGRLYGGPVMYVGQIGLWVLCIMAGLKML